MICDFLNLKEFDLYFKNLWIYVLSVVFKVLHFCYIKTAMFDSKIVIYVI